MSKKEDSQEVQIYSDMTYCPECGSIQNKKENFCSHCGGSLHAKAVKKQANNHQVSENVLDLSDEEKTRNKKPFFKNKNFWILSGVFLIAISVIGGLFWLKASEGNAFEREVKGVWQEVINASNQLNKKVSEMQDIEEFNSITLLVKDTQKIIETQKDALRELVTPNEYEEAKKELNNGFEKYREYLQELRSVSESPKDFTNQDIKDIENLATEMKASFDRAYIKFSFIAEKLSDETYVIIDKFQKVRKDYEDKLEEEEQLKASEERQTKEQQEARAKAEQAVTSFMNAYIAGNQTELNKYMTAAFKKEFNYADLSSAARSYSYPESFRITETKYSSSTQYDIYGIELQVNRDSGNKWTINRQFAVLYVQSENKWLIDRWNIP